MNRITLMLLAVFLYAWGGTASAQLKPDWQADKSEAVLLPQYCWNQMLDPNLKDSKYSIPCGGGMNHYCLGLLAEIRANRTSGNMPLKKLYLDRAKTNIRYTLDRMEPSCSIAGDVQASAMRIDRLNRMYHNY